MAKNKFLYFEDLMGIIFEIDIWTFLCVQAKKVTENMVLLQALWKNKSNLIVSCKNQCNYERITKFLPSLTSLFGCDS